MGVWQPGSTAHYEMCQISLRRTRSREGKYEPCPECGSLDVVPILYGEPGPELIEEERQGKIALGGCFDPHTLPPIMDNAADKDEGERRD